jgi:DNA polymerase V
MKEQAYLCIDLKSFYASVECVERGLNPMTTNLVVADPERSDKTICLAVSPSLKKLGVRNRCRVFEIPKNIKYIMATPRMQKYIDYAAAIYGIYLRYLSKEDIHVYSIDEAFLYVTPYLPLYQTTPRSMALFLMNKITEELGVRATCGIGTNLYLAKIALDIKAKHSPDFISQLDENSYRSTLWQHMPLTDFWRIGPGTAARLAKYGLFTMEQIAKAPEELLYRLFGIDAELLIDHAWGRESTTLSDIKAYRPQSHCLARGQVLMRDYSFAEGRIIVKEMLDLLCLELVEKQLVTKTITLYISYSHLYQIPAAKGTACLPFATSMNELIIPAVLQVYEQIMKHHLPIRRVSICCCNVTPDQGLREIDLFAPDMGTTIERNKELQQAVLKIKKRFGKNSLLKALDLEDAATTKERNNQIGGHKSGIET